MPSLRGGGDVPCCLRPAEDPPWWMTYGLPWIFLWPASTLSIKSIVSMPAAPYSPVGTPEISPG